MMEEAPNPFTNTNCLFKIQKVRIQVWEIIWLTPNSIRLIPSDAGDQQAYKVSVKVKKLLLR